jgi:uncharacterized protein (TIGR03083 family)
MSSSWDLVDVARTDLVGLLDSFTDAQWNAQSLCSAWRVRDVVAHLTSIHRVGVGAMLWGVIAHRFSADRFMAVEARAHGEAPPRELLAELKRMIGSRRKPPVVTPEVLVYDLTVHTQDIAQPLGIPYAPRREALELVVATKMIRPAARGLTLRATDLGWSSGTGPEVRGPAACLLLALAKRPAGLSSLEGEGRALLAARMG